MRRCSRHQNVVEFDAPQHVANRRVAKFADFDRIGFGSGGGSAALRMLLELVMIAALRSTTLRSFATSGYSCRWRLRAR